MPSTILAQLPATPSSQVAAVAGGKPRGSPPGGAGEGFRATLDASVANRESTPSPAAATRRPPTREPALAQQSSVERSSRRRSEEAKSGGPGGPQGAGKQDEVPYQGSAEAPTSRLTPEAPATATRGEREASPPLESAPEEHEEPLAQPPGTTAPAASLHWGAVNAAQGFASIQDAEGGDGHAGGGDAGGQATSEYARLGTFGQVFAASQSPGGEGQLLVQETAASSNPDHLAATPASLFGMSMAGGALPHTARDGALQQGASTSQGVGSTAAEATEGGLRAALPAGAGVPMGTETEVGQAAAGVATVASPGQSAVTAPAAGGSETPQAGPARTASARAGSPKLAGQPAQPSTPGAVASTSAAEAGERSVSAAAQTGSAVASAALPEDADDALHGGNLPSGATPLEVNPDAGTSNGRADRQASAARSAAAGHTFSSAASGATKPTLALASGDAGAEARGGGPAAQPADKAGLGSFSAKGDPALHSDKVGKPFDLSQPGTSPQRHDTSLLDGAARSGAEVHARRADEAFDVTLLGNLGRDGGLAARLSTQGDARGASAAASQTLGTGANPPPPAQILTQLLEQIAGRATSLVRDGQHTLQVQLRPEELGRLSLKIVTDHDKVTASFLVESTAVKELLESNVAQLRASLHDQGLRFDGLQVNVSNQPGQGFEQQLGSERGPRPGWGRAERLAEAIDPGAPSGGAAAEALAPSHGGIVHLVV